MAAIPGIYLRGKVYWMRYSRLGKQCFVSLETNDLAEGIRRAAKIRTNPLTKSQATIGDLIDKFLRYKQTKAKRRYTRHSAYNKKYVLRRVDHYFDGKSISKITPKDMERFYEKTASKRTEQTAHTYLLCARAFFNWCVDTERIMLVNPCKEFTVSIDQTFSRKRFCEPALMHKLIDEAPNQQMKFILYSGFHGMRFNEIVEAIPSWFDLDRKEIHVEETPHFLPKNKKRRTIPIADDFLEFLKTYPLNGKYCIAPAVERGIAKYRYDFTRPFRLYMKKQGCPWVTPHVLRHTFTTLLYFANTPLIKISQWSGDTVRVLERHYIHEVPGDREINNLMKRPAPTSQPEAPVAVPIQATG